MKAVEFVELLRRKPFIPLRIHMSDGVTYEIYHPDNIIVGRTRVDIGRGADPQGIVDRVDYCSLEHVVRVEEIAKKAKSKGTQA
ncbi:MAG: hypothetical protein FJ303_20490 [Planctomycetes bacterium]|nr:hypothetical protein [Planctomycetota bacterium]